MKARSGAREMLAVGAAAAGFLYLVFFRRGTPIFPFVTGSNGVFLDEGLRILDGELPYRDYFEFVSPGNAYLNAGVLWLFGRRASAMAGAFVLQGAFLTLLLHALAARLAGPGWRLLPPLAFAVLAYAPYTIGDHKWPALAFAAGGLLVLRGGPGEASRTVLGGLLLGMSPLFTQDLGAGACAGTLLHFALARTPLARLAGLAVLFALPSVVALGTLAMHAGLGTVLETSLLFPVTRYQEFNRFHVSVAPSWRTLPREAAQIVLAGACVLAALSLLRREAEPEGRLLAWTGLGVLLATLHRGVYGAVLSVQAALLLPVCARALERGWRAGRLAPVSRLVGAIVALGLGHGSLGFVPWRQAMQPLVPEQHRAGSVWTPQPMPELIWIESQTTAGEAVFLLPARCGQYFLSGTRAATSFPYLIEGQSTLEQANRALSEIEQREPRVGLWDTRPTGAAPPVGPVLSPLLQGLLRLYDAEQLPSGVLLMTRKPKAGLPAVSGQPRP